MRLVVLDTNVVVSAAIRAGSPPAELMMDWILEGKVQIVTSPMIVAEYREVLQRPKFRRYRFPPLWLDFLIDESLHLSDPPTDTKQWPDPHDAVFLRIAQRSGAWLVTGNLKHFPERLRGDVKVLSPAQYVTLLSDE
jgi:uncharacterized protein